MPDPVERLAVDIRAAGDSSERVLEGSSMSDYDDSGTASGVDIVSDLEAINVAVDYAVISLGPRSWGIRGHIAYDGDVLAAIFPNERQAWVAISPLRPAAER
jgi:hypothetical protein